ncbi:sensor histidine kinase [Bacillus sp. E214]|uniref:sensor histidine kinase n=1 Tax=Bacillus sp. E214 TaxID=2587156 RepID=UPI0011DF3A9D|nr:sensor histidine kinase [Bacillus sp. E214]
MIAYITRKLNNMKLRDKLIISLVILVAIPISIVGLYLTQQLRNGAIEDAISESKMNMERMKKRTAEVLKVPIYISDNLQFDQQLDTVANTSYDSRYQVVEAYENYKLFTYYLEYYNEISTIRFFMDNPTMLNNWEFIPIDEEVKKEEWYQETTKNPDLMRWYYVNDSTKDNGPYLSLVRRINFLKTNTYGALVITVNTSELEWILNQETLRAMIVDEENNIVASNQKKHIGQKLSSVIPSLEKVSEEDGFKVYEGKLNGKKSVVMEDSLLEQSQDHLRIISVMTEDQMMKDANNISMMGFFVTLLGFTLAGVLISIVSILYSKRVSKLSKQIDLVSAGDLSSMIEVDGEDEIGTLSKQFNRMVANLRELIAKVEETNRQKSLLEIRQNEIKIKMMASQINPHFLFNTLESIRMKAHMEGAKDVANVVKMLGRMMRHSLEIQGQKIPLSKELEMVNLYLQIQKFRYQDRLEYELDIEEEALTVLIQPLIIQPLVENAVIHGFDLLDNGGKVWVTIEKKECDLEIIVSDNGIGISEQRLMDILQSINHQEEGKHIGLRNVHQRMVLIYGEEYGLSIQSELNKGTVIQFRIPIGRDSHV